MIDKSPGRPAGRRSSGGPQRRRPLARAVSILEVLAAADEGLGLSELARRAGVPKTSARRVLADLLAARMVVQERGRYLPGERLLALAAQVSSPGSSFLSRLVLPYVVLLHDETGLDVSFATMRHGQVRFEAILYRPEYAPVFASLPSPCPTHCTSSGKILLAHVVPFRPLPGRSAVLPRYTDTTITDPRALVNALVRARAAGFAASHGEFVDGIGSLAVPVFGNLRQSIGALAVCGRIDQIDQGADLLRLRRVATAVGAAFRAAVA